jgi:hypothetical protein
VGREEILPSFYVIMHQNFLSPDGNIQRSEETSQFSKWFSSWFCCGDEYFGLSNYVLWFPKFKKKTAKYQIKVYNFWITVKVIRA